MARLEFMCRRQCCGAVPFWPRLQLVKMAAPAPALAPTPALAPQFIAEKKFYKISLLNLPELDLFTKRYKSFTLLLQFFT